MIEFSDSILGFRPHVPATQKSAYLLTASTGLVPDFIYDGIRRYMDARYFNGGNSVWEFPDGTVGTLEMLERSKAALGAMLGCNGTDIAFGQSATQMFTMVTEGIEYAPGANVVTIGEGWIGNRFAWQKREAEGLEVRYTPQRNGHISADDLMELCDAHTAAVTVNLVESSTGYRADVERLGTFCRERDILLFVDAVQAAGALRVDVSKANIDFLVGNDYKWMMNFCGTGYACIGDRVKPLIRRWGAGWMSDTDRFNTQKARLELREDAGRFEIGYPHADGIYGLGLAAAQYLRLGAENIENYVLSLAETCRERAEQIDGVRCAYDTPAQQCSQIVPLMIDGKIQMTDEDFKRAGVCVPSLAFSDTQGRRNMRLSFHYYNTQEDIERFFDVIETAKQR